MISRRVEHPCICVTQAAENGKVKDYETKRRNKMSVSAIIQLVIAVLNIVAMIVSFFVPSA